MHKIGNALFYVAAQLFSLCYIMSINIKFVYKQSISPRNNLHKLVSHCVHAI